MIRLLSKVVFGGLILCSGAALTACRKPATATTTPAAAARQPSPQPSVCNAENVSRATLLRATPPPAQPTPR